MGLDTSTLLFHSIMLRPGAHPENEPGFFQRGRHLDRPAMRLRDLQGNTEPQSKTRIIIGRRYGLTCMRPAAPCSQSAPVSPGAAFQWHCGVQVDSEELLRPA